MRLLALALLLSASAGASAEGAELLSGVARVIDGDTLAIGNRVVRLAGIDAPERNQTCWHGDAEMACGRLAAAALADLAQGELLCTPTGAISYGRVVAVCRGPRSEDIGRDMVRDGWAFAVPGYKPDYSADEAEARAQGNYLHAVRVTPPWKWRRMMEAASASGAGAARRR